MIKKKNLKSLSRFHKSEAKFCQPCPTFCIPMDCIFHGILPAWILVWEPFTSPGDLPNPGIEPRSPALKMDNLPAEPPGKPKNIGKQDVHGPDCSFLIPKFRRKTLVVFFILWVKLDFIVLIKSTITAEERKKKKKKRKKSKRNCWTSQNIRIVYIFLESLLSASFPLLGVIVHLDSPGCPPTLCWSLDLLWASSDSNLVLHLCVLASNVHSYQN